MESGDTCIDTCGEEQSICKHIGTGLQVRHLPSKNLHSNHIFVLKKKKIKKKNEK
jgi:hypothetical protein